MSSPFPVRNGAISPVSITKKSAVSLLPAFEPLSSSPALPRPLKRTRDTFEDTRTYPTPVPTSSTNILSSSPTRASAVRPSAQRSLSTLSERAPLSAVPVIILNADGKTIRLGRSSASCEYQLSANRLISRVHVEAVYKPATSRLDRDRVEILCSGWNGIKVHCQSQVYELKKGETFSSDMRDDEIMLDVHDTRVVLQWPEKPHLGAVSSDEEDPFTSPTKKQRGMRPHSTPPSPSPMQSRRRAQSPISPSPAVQALLPSSPPALLFSESKAIVEIYEDPVLPQEEEVHLENIDPSQQATQKLCQVQELISPTTEVASDATPNPNEFSDNDEENDPIIHSFGPFGANLLPRMAAFSAADSPRTVPLAKSSRSCHSEPLQPTQSPAPHRNEKEDVDVQSHIINQLAYSRLSSTPLSTILSHLPRDAADYTKYEIRQIIRQTKCIGEVTREGKDAAGKALESEFYYVPDEDDDEQRKASVVNDLRKPGLRACRKQHKQYFWRKPK